MSRFSSAQFLSVGALFLVGIAFFPFSFLTASQPRQAGDRMVLEINGVEYPFRYCPAGTFTMGSPVAEEGRDSDEGEHPVTLTEDFWLLETEVTGEMWRSVFGNDESNLSHKENQLPVYGVTWDESLEFCRALSASSGRVFTLPSEAQWEYACRAGASGPYGKSGSLDKIGWYRDNCAGPQKVGQKEPNPWGFYDMQGNVWEWCTDLFGMNSSDAVTDPDGAYIGGFRIIRGGAWDCPSAYCRAAYRYFYFPKHRLDSIGLRILLTNP